MSETTAPPASEPQPNAPSVDPPASAPQPEPERVPSPAPVSETEPAPEQTEEQKAEAKSRGDRRFAELTAKLSAEARERARLASENEYLRQQTARLPPQPPTPEQEIQRLRNEVRAEVERDLIIRRFHDEGRAQFSDWDLKTRNLIELGADAGVAQLLVETPGGVRLAAALADDPAEVQRIANIQTAAGRAVALGKYAAMLEAAGGNGLEHVPRVAAVAPSQVTRAPAPIRPVQGRASPVFNEYTATSQDLVDFYMKRDLEQRQRK